MMMQPMEQEQTREPAPMTGGSALSFRIKRIGQRPLEFSGTELGMAMSYVPGAPYWYEINIYRTVDQKFVVAVRHFFESEDEQDTARAWECDDFFSAMDMLEAYDAADDVRVYADPEGKGLSVPELLAAAHTHRAAAMAARQQFGGLVGQILSELSEG
ncbi:MAG: hypothetical protein AAF281_05915 [Pseudomonadota bacterium]